MRSRAALPGALGLIFIGLALSGREPRPPAEAVRELSLGEAYEVTVGSKRTTLDLLFDASTRYLVIVGSLAPFGPPQEVVISSEECAEPSPLPVRRVDYAPFRTTTHDKPADVRLAGATLRVAGVERSEPPATPLPNHASRPGATRTFFVHVTDGDLGDPKQYVRVTGREIAAGRTVRLFLDDKQASQHVARGLTDELIRLCDEEIIPAVSAAVGPCRDIDADGRFTILLTPWLNALQGGRTSLGGFVRSTDFDPTLPEHLSNRGDILYLNATLTPGPHLRMLVAHEFMHAACISARLPSPERPVGLPYEEDWISEALAHLAENAWGPGWSNLDYRVAEYLDDPARYPLVVPDYYRAGLWRCHGCRGATWLFLRWCADQSGPGFLEALAHAPASGTANLEHVTGQRFAELFRRWSLTVACSGTSLRGPCPDDYATLRLIGPLGTKQLGGPRVVHWDVDTGPQRVELASTSAAFLDLTATGPASTRRIRIDAPASAHLQVTILKATRTISDPSGPTQIVLSR